MRRAFTLIELLIVIAIIALLIGILLPALGFAKARTHAVICDSNLRQLFLATTNYCAQNQEFLPFSNSNVLAPKWPGPGWLYLQPSGGLGTLSDDTLATYMHTGVLWTYIGGGTRLAPSSSSAAGARKVYRCPTDRPPYTAGPCQKITSYVMNGAVNSYTTRVPSYRISQFRNDAICYWEVDETGGSGLWNDASSYPDEGMTKRHVKAASVACFDGSTRQMSHADFAQELTRHPGRLWCDPGRTDGGHH